MKPIVLAHEKTLTIHRDENGIPHVTASTEKDLYFGQGYAQAMDRGMQLCLTRILGQGRACECLKTTDELLNIDIFFRKMNWSGDAHNQVSKIPPDIRVLVDSFVAGVNAGLAKYRPFEFRLVGYKPEPWKAEDCILLMRMIGYVGLQQSQAELERFVVELVQAGIGKDRLEELFPGMLEGLDIDLLRKVDLGERMIPRSLWNTGIVAMISSNNWVVAPRRSASGKALLMNDPHLETNRLPNVWQEIVLKMGDRYAMGAGMPGLPGVVIGRNNDVAWGATYTFMDGVDSWIEECREGKFRRGSLFMTEWVRFKERRETIQRKKKPPVTISFFENEHGVLDGDPYRAGFYLSTRWASGSDTGAKSVEIPMRLFHATSAKQAMEHLGELEVSFNWVFADGEGNIGYQMSGLMPRRRGGISGLVPLPGWDSKNDWKGFMPFRNLPHRYNPQEGYIVTANNDLNSWGRTQPISVSMGPYRADRIAQKLAAGNAHTLEEMAKIQYDDYSLQAEKFMEFVRPLIPDSPAGKVLREWDCRYDVNSKAAGIFERFYKSYIRNVFGRLGSDVLDHLLDRTGLVVDFYAAMDKVLLSRKSVWFEGRNRDDLVRRALDTALSVTPRAWGEDRKLTLTNIFFGGSLPRFLRIDRGPVTLPGGRATPHQAQIFESAGRKTSFVASFRMLIDLSDEGIRTNMAGGPSDRPFSRWYASDLENWLTGRFKRVRP